MHKVQGSITSATRGRGERERERERWAKEMRLLKKCKVAKEGKVKISRSNLEILILKSKVGCNF
jgi:hypothetical protein